MEQSEERHASLKESKAELKSEQSRNVDLNAQNSLLIKEASTLQNRIIQLERITAELKEKWKAAKNVEAQQAKQIEKLTKERRPVVN